MRKQFIVGLLIVVWFTSVATNVAEAQTNRGFVICIPFEFSVAGRILPEGTYVLERIDHTKPNVLLLKNADNGMVRLLFTQRIERWHVTSESSLIFTGRGRQLHLTQIWMKGNLNGQQVPSSDEKGHRNKRISDISVQLKLTRTSSKELKSTLARNTIAESKHR